MTKIPLKYKIAFIFALGFSFAFLALKNLQTTSAADLTFSAGNIISDFVMSDTSTMTVDDIQAFLTAKNPCNNRNYELYKQQSTAYPKISWHWTGTPSDGHFVCLSEERFGNGVVYGDKLKDGEGQTAAEIIYAAAQEYQINPQVLLVLLEKEQALITDSYPHSNQYRSATGYGCPDTAACDSKYYGFKNQIYNAAWLFRYTLDNGSVTFPENVPGVYVAYNPAASCGGSEVLIENRATAGLYRYTPYQPNSAALAAGSGLGDYCSAYGNRNFFNYFVKWFGNPRAEAVQPMSVARLFEVKAETKYRDPETGEEKSTMEDQYKYFTYRTKVKGSLCLLTSADATECVLYDDLIDYPVAEPSKMDVARLLFIHTEKGINLLSGTSHAMTEEETDSTVFTYKATVLGKLCLGTDDMAGDAPWCVFYDDLEEFTPTVSSKMSVPRSFYIPAGTKGYNFQTGLPHVTEEDEIAHFSHRTTFLGDLCLQTATAQKQGVTTCYKYDDLHEVLTFSAMSVPRTISINPGTVYTSTIGKTVSEPVESDELYFSKRTDVDGELCLASDADAAVGRCILYSNLSE